MNIPKYILIHGSDVSYRKAPNQFNAINNYHRDERQFPVSSLGYYIGYHRLITNDNNYQCRLDKDEGAHCNQGFDGVTVYPPASGKALTMNYQSLGVCVGFDGDIELPTLKQYELLQQQVWEWQDQYGIPNDRIFFHRKFSKDKTCPGSLITSQWLVDLLKRPQPIVLKPIENMCQEEKKVIIEQNRIISNLRQLVQDLLSLFRK